MSKGIQKRFKRFIGVLEGFNQFQGFSNLIQEISRSLRGVQSYYGGVSGMLLGNSGAYQGFSRNFRSVLMDFWAFGSVAGGLKVVQE